MKLRLTKDRKSGSQTLVVKPTKHETLEYDQAEWARTYEGEGLVPFRYVRDNDVTLYYDVTGLVGLKSYLKAEISLDQYRRILAQLADLLGTCTRQQLPSSAIQFEPERVYLDAQGAPKFVFVPLSGVAERRESSPVAFLHYLGGKHVKFVVDDDRRHASAVEDFASRNQVLSLSALREFLQRDLGVTVRGDSGSLSGGTGGLGRRAGSGSLGSGALGASPAMPGAGQMSGAAPGFGAGGAGGHMSGCAPVSGFRPAPGYAQPSGAQPAAFGVSRPSAPVVAFDPVALLAGAPSATQVVQSQTVGARVRNAVGGLSPTAGVTGPAVAPSAPVRAAVAGVSALESVREPAARAPSLAEGAPAVEVAPAAPAAASQLPASAASAEAGPMPPAEDVHPTPASAMPVPAPPPPAPAPVAGGGTTLLGSAAIPSVAATSFASQIQRPAFLERVATGERLPLQLTDGPVVVGRSVRSNVQVAGNSNISRAHAEVIRINGTYALCDLGSANGTFVAGRRLERGERAQVRPGEPFRLANEDFRIVEG